MTNTVTIKINREGVATLAHPGAEPGYEPATGNMIWQITGCPIGVTPGEVLRLFERTAIVRVTPKARWNELGRDVIVKGPYRDHEARPGP